MIEYVQTLREAGLGARLHHPPVDRVDRVLGSRRRLPLADGAELLLLEEGRGQEDGPLGGWAEQEAGQGAAEHKQRRRQTQQRTQAHQTRHHLHLRCNNIYHGIG